MKMKFKQNLQPIYQYSLSITLIYNILMFFKHKLYINITKFLQHNILVYQNSLNRLQSLNHLYPYRTLPTTYAYPR